MLFDQSSCGGLFSKKELEISCYILRVPFHPDHPTHPSLAYFEKTEFQDLKSLLHKSEDICLFYHNMNITIIFMMLVFMQ